MRATEHVELLLAIPQQQPDPQAQSCRQSMHRTLAHFVACQRSWLPLIQAIINGRARAAVKLHPLKLMESTGLLQTEWSELTAEYVRNAELWESLTNAADPLHKLTVGHRTWTVTELTERLVGHESHHLAEHGLVAP